MSEQCTTQYHPTDDELVRFVVDRNGTDLSAHMAQCPACARFVKEIEMVRRDIEDLPDEEVSPSLRSRIFSRRGASDSPTFHTYKELGGWWRNPLFIGLGVGIFAVFLYIFFVFLL